MLRKLQPARGALPLAVSHAGMAPGAPGSASEPSSGPSIVGPLALDVVGAADGVAARAASSEPSVDRAVRDRRHKLGIGHGRATEGADLTEPATPVSLVRDPIDTESESAGRLAAEAVKRVIDVAVALVGLIVAAPVLVVLAVLVRAGSPGSVLFAQARVGRGGRMFRCYKLRTMRHDAESLLRSDAELRATYERHGFKIPCEADHRVTRIGRLLRLTSCDELPQLWNVLKGEMSLVGPRPLVARELSHYPGADRDLLLSVRPGLTGAWAVGGRSRVNYPRRAIMELDYVRHWSLRRDFGILLRTIGAVLARRGAS